MRCPHCGNYIENTLWRALEPYRNSSKKVVVTNIDSILEVGPRIRAIFEEKGGKNFRIRGYQAVTLKKVARSLRVPLLYIHRVGEEVELYQYDVNEPVRSHVYLDPESLDPVFSGSIEELGEWIFSKFISNGPLSREDKKRGGGKVVGNSRKGCV